MKPSIFIENSDYATSQNDDAGSIQLVIPTNINVPQGTIIAPFEATGEIGSKAACMRFNLSSNKYPGKSITTPSFHIPATYTDNYGSYDEVLIGYIYMSAPGVVCIRVEPNYPGGQMGTMRITNCGQTLTLKVCSFISPFEA